MQVLKVVAEGMVTSFRYPYFVQGVHPTFEMPPPATIYGHVCSAVGDFIPPDSTRFAYHFSYEGRFKDYEHLLFFPDESPLKPATRELLFRPKLTLYLSNVALIDAFRRPRYAVTLGRGQDLMTYPATSPPHLVNLQPAHHAFFERTLLPLDEAPAFGEYAYTVTMPRYIDARRRVTNGRYAVITKAVEYPNEKALQFEGYPTQTYFVDPYESHPVSGLKRGVIWHDWV
jgi:CRISPR-associated protein Cas5t